MKYQKILKVDYSFIPIIVILLFFFGFSSIMSVTGGIVVAIFNGKISSLDLLSVAGILELLAVLACIIFIIRIYQKGQNYREAKLNGEIQIYPEYICETGAFISNVPEYEIIFSHDTPLGIKQTIRGVPIHDPLFYETMRTVPLTVYSLGEEYYTSSKELMQFTHNLMISLSVRHREVMQEIQNKNRYNN